MTEEKKDPAKDTPTAIMALRDLKKMVTDQVTEAMKAVTGTLGGDGGQQQPPQQQQTAPRGGAPRRNVQDEVTAALEKIEKDREREAREAGWEKDLAELKEKTKERAPVERSRMHRIMGWGD